MRKGADTCTLINNELGFQAYEIEAALELASEFISIVFVVDDF